MKSSKTKLLSHLELVPLIFCAALMFSASYLGAQSIMATIQGSVLDASGGAIPNASLSVKNVTTGAVRSGSSNSLGIFSFPDLPPSDYEVSVSAAGFTSKRITDITLTVGANRVINVSLAPSTVQTSVEVTGAAPPVDLANAALGGVESPESIRELPLNGRDWTQVATLQPGVAQIRLQQTLASTSSRGTRGYGSEVTIGGTRPTQNNYFVDGISENDYANSSPGSSIGLALGVDAIEEFSVVTNAYDASYGNTSGGVVNAVTRSGTNQFHGDAYEFLRNDVLDARNFFDGKKPPFRRNQFGVAAGAPIRKDKTFIFANYEGLRQVQSTTTISTVLSPAARAGNLSTGKVTVSPLIQPYLVFWPLPNGPLLGAGDTGQYSFVARSSANGDMGTIKVVHLLSQTDTLSFLYSADNGSTEIPDSLNSIFIGGVLRRNTASISEVHVFNPRVLNSFRTGMNRVVAHALTTFPGNNPAATDPSLGILPGRDAPQLQVPGLTTFGGGLGSAAYSNFWFTNFQFYDDLSIQKGRHAIKLGGDFIRYRYNIQLSNAPDGEYVFNSLSDFLTDGKITSFIADVDFSGGQVSGQTGFPERGFRQNVDGVYAEDDIHLRHNVTVNLGLRYETSSVPGEVHGITENLRDIYGTNLNIGQPLFQNPTHLNFEPRVGVAWDPFGDGKTSVRSGFGIFDVLPLAYNVVPTETNSGPFSSAVTLTNPPAGSFPNGGYNEALSLGSTVPVRDASIQYNPRRNYVMQWNVSVQRILARNLTLQVAYAGSHGVHMVTMFNDVDFTPPTLTPQGYLWPTPIGSGAKPNTSIGSIRQIIWGGSAVYDALEVRLQQRFRHGFGIQGSFTWQKSIDDFSSSVLSNQFLNSTNLFDFNLHINRGPSDFDIGRVLVLSGTWELPKMKSGPAAAKAILNGWGTAAIFQASDGTPFTPVITGDAVGANSTGVTEFPNRVVGSACTHLVNPGNPNGYINLSCYSFPAPRNLLGNAGRNSLIGPGLAELDFSITRTFPLPFLSEASHLQFRAEAFNLANRANFDPPLPNNSLYNATGAPLATAGIITATATSSRQLQFALRLVW